MFPGAFTKIERNGIRNQIISDETYAKYTRRRHQSHIVLLEVSVVSFV